MVLRALVLLLVGVLWPQDAVGQRQPYEYMRSLTTAINQIRDSYLDPVDYGVMVRAAIDGILSELDPYSRYVPAEQWVAWLAAQHGEYAGVGVILEPVNDALTVLAVLPHGPADEKGVLPGDRIVAVDDSAVAGRDIVEVNGWLTGADGSVVALSLERGSPLAPTTITTRLKRRPLDIPAVWRSGMVDDETGYVLFIQFSPVAAEQLEDAVKRLEKKGAERLILDLRGNPGGNVRSLIEVAGLFLPRSTVVMRTRGRAANRTVVERTRGDPEFDDLPLVVLIDGTSASAAEMLAGALQDHDRALLVGEHTFGKGLVQTAFPLAGGDVVWLTTDRVTTPSGRPFDRAAVDEDSNAVFRTDNGREIAVGVGIPPDVHLAVRPEPPAWWLEATGSGMVVSLTDSVANGLRRDDATRQAWVTDSTLWGEKIVDPLLKRTRLEYAIEPTLEPDQRRHLSLWLARRVVEQCWGADAEAELLMRNDDGVRFAREQFPKLEEVLGGEGGE
jgi:carboxyl-terminal processing protease